MPKPLTIGLLWHSLNSDNLGVGALTVSHLAILRDVLAAEGLTARFVIIGWTDPKPHYFARDDVEVVQLRMKDFLNPNGLFRTLRRCDAVFDIGAGDSFADIYGPQRILRMIAAQNLTLFARRPLIFSPQTIGPFAPGYVRRLALRSLRRARMVATRDDLSTAFAREMGFDGPLTEATDVALRLPFEPPAPRAPGGPVKVGLNVSGLLFNGGYGRDNSLGLTVDYAALMREIVGWFVSRGDCEVHLVGHVVSDVHAVEDDGAAGEALAEAFPGCVVAPRFPDPSAAKSYIAGMDFFAGARMHACIAAFSSGAPVLPIAYSRKFKGLFGALGYDHNADCKTEDQAAIVAKVKHAFENRAALKAEADAAFARGLKRLGVYEDGVREILRAAARRS